MYKNYEKLTILIFSLQVIYTVIHCYIEGDTMIIINNSSMIPIYEQIVNQVKQNIVDGKLKEGDALPSVRGLSKELKISALTVKKAYDILETDGLCRTVQGKGSFVLGVNPGLVHEQRVVEIQKDLEKVLDKAKSYDLSKDEIRDLFEILMEE
jgi:GntR family transcriptional regulator